ncbi:GIY-YIG nuclease family protein [Cohnella silvisoli]|uniref:GIY-YIG nuclease family protein n=1 Tax=Cohnella silvisoli TaxID=2873699 RepID=UPI001E3339CA
MSSVYAIYLIADRKDGKLYVGSAFDTGGLLNRWKSFVDTKHGGNKGMKELVCNFPDRYEYFQFSILQIIPKNITAEEVIEVENLYKKKLMSIDFGMNEN